jgi:hypothetical protein
VGHIGRSPVPARSQESPATDFGLAQCSLAQLIRWAAAQRSRSGALGTRLTTSQKAKISVACTQVLATVVIWLLVRVPSSVTGLCTRWHSK